MNKIITGILVAAVLLPVAAFAAVDCVSFPNDPACQQGGGPNPENVTNVWGGTNSSVPHIQPGQSRVNKFGQTNYCPWYFTNYCVDISETAYYVSRQ